MSPTTYFSPEAIHRMRPSMNVRCRNSLERAPVHERDRLAVYILSIGNILQDPSRMLDRAVRMYHRVTRLDGPPSRSAFEPDL